MMVVTISDDGNIATPIARGNAGSFDLTRGVSFQLTLVNDHPETQFFYFIIRLLQSSTCFEERCAHHQEVKLY